MNNMNNRILASVRLPGIAGKLAILATAAALAIPLAVNGEPAEDAAAEDAETHVTDLRTFAELPEKARRVLREDMLDHLAVLNEINRYLSENDLQSAAEVAETGMGKSLLSKYQDQDMRPGRYMPKEMREIGWELHKAASEFAAAARQGDLHKTLVAYHHITTTCVACHYSFRTR
jgi:hypothetical protein